MTVRVIPLLAQAADLAEPVRRSYRLARLALHEGQAWFPLAVALVVVAVMVYVWVVARRDCADRPAGMAAVLFLLRAIALTGLLVFFLDPERRDVYRSIRPSQVLMLIDSSQSMGLPDGAKGAGDQVVRRSDAVARALRDAPLLRQLRQTHEVLVDAFGDDLRPVARLPRLEPLTAQPPAAQPATAQVVEWEEVLQPRDRETRLGDALLGALRKHRADPLAGIVVVSDGGQNAGVGIDPALRLARQAGVGIYPVGVGSDQAPRNVAVREVVAPNRAYPGDAFTITAYLMGSRMAGRTVSVELAVAPSGSAGGAASAAAVLERQRVVVGADGEVVPVRFEVKESTSGRRTFAVRVPAVAGDENPSDNRQVVDVEIVGRESRVLLFAGGATREYRFLRNQLWRDKEVEVHVVLQSALPGISQDADQILDAFPASREALYCYDAIVCFDPDWSALTERQVQLLEQWVSDEAGGLILVAGPVYTHRLAQHAPATALLDLFPVRLRRPFSVLDDLPSGGRTPWPVEFTREGLEADYLYLEDSAAASAAAWNAFPGVYSCYPSSDAKPGATRLAHFSDPQAASDRQRPILFAEQFYGAGRVFYMGTGEMWRLRTLDEGYFETFYTKLIRHVAQGRLLRGSSRGLLLVDRDRYSLGDSVAVRAQLSDIHHRPLALPSVTLQVTLPNGRTMPLRLDREPVREGTYAGNFRVGLEGPYTLELALPDSADPPLTRHLQVRVPDREREHPQRNDALLSQIAQRTNGYYYVGLDAAARGGQVMPLATRLPDRTEETLVTGAPDRTFEQQLTLVLLAVIAGSLTLEWLIRRLNRMA